MGETELNQTNTWWNVLLIILLCYPFFRRPFNNPTETYRYYSLPFCRTHADEKEHQEALEEELPPGAGGLPGMGDDDASGEGVL